MPSRRDVDPLAIPGYLLAHLELIDVFHHPELRFRWRLIGTHVTTAVGRDQRGGILTRFVRATIWRLYPNRSNGWLKTSSHSVG